MDLFDGMVKETDLLWEAHADMKESLDKTRKRLFGELQELRDHIREANAQIERLNYTERHAERKHPKLQLVEHGE